MKHSEYSVVIVGSGAAGLYAALKLSEQISLPDGILLVTKSILGESNSKYAQGGIVGVLHQNSADNVDSHVIDTLKAGAGLSDKDVTQFISEISNDVINDLIKFGVNFDKNSEGKLNFTLEAAHSCRRILHVGGDATGKGIIEALAEKARNDSNITILENCMAVELLVNSEKSCKGIILYNTLTNEHELVYSSAIVLATGGMGQVYKYTTNPDCATADGVDLAYNAGAIMQDMEFIQFHPTALALGASSKNRFLISEAVRGEGAKLVNKSGQEFMSNYHDKRELAPRDIVTRAIFTEMQSSNSSNMFLNASIIDKAKLLMRFPTISIKCKENGIDITKMPIPVAPAAHYSMGGIKASVEGRTSIKGLYAIGEVASTGLHGANRLASNSLLECVACAYELANYLSFTNLVPPKKIDNAIMEVINRYSANINEFDYDIKALKDKLKDIMWNNVGIVRNESGLRDANREVQRMINEFKRNRKCASQDEYEYRNMLTAAQLIIQSALERKESRGAHSRSDYKETLLDATHSNIIKNKKELVYVE